MKKILNYIYAMYGYYSVELYVLFCKLINKCEECNGSGIYRHPHEDLKWKCNCCNGTGKYIKKQKPDYKKIKD